VAFSLFGLPLRIAFGNDGIQIRIWVARRTFEDRFIVYEISMMVDSANWISEQRRFSGELDHGSLREGTQNLLEDLVDCIAVSFTSAPVEMQAVEHNLAPQGRESARFSRTVHLS
jgi:hypothetical protein